MEADAVSAFSALSRFPSQRHSAPWASIDPLAKTSGL